jgi:hypothetical protein
MSYSLGENLDSAYKSAKIFFELLNRAFSKELPVINYDYDPDLMGHLARPSPGSAFYYLAQQKGLVLAQNWSQHTEEEINFIPFELLYDTPEILIHLKKSDYLKMMKMYIDNLTLFVNQNFYISLPILKKYFNNNYAELINYIWDIYKLIDGNLTVKDVVLSQIESGVGDDIHSDEPLTKRFKGSGEYKEKLIKSVCALSLLSIFRIIQSGSKLCKH